MGYAIRYVAAMKVYHPARPDLASLKVKWDRHTAHFFEESARGSAGRLKWLARTLAMALSPLGEIPRILTSDRIAGLRSRRLAFIVLAQIRAYRARIMLWLALGGDPSRLSGAWNRRPAAKRE